MQSFKIVSHPYIDHGVRKDQPTILLCCCTRRPHDRDVDHISQQDAYPINYYVIQYYLLFTTNFVLT